MNQEIKAKWVAALRSGEYKQGKSQLKQTEKDGCVTHCCLGVLTELYAKEHNIDFTGEDDTLKDLQINSELLCPTVMGWAELSSNDPVVVENECEDGLAALNDGGATFEEIADLIERQV